ncbi:TetR/AcrR family transcriptional regulator [Fodinicola acaciae]|uniref:TetR/AcrR family transcriptional regulator n=1 Tax=Fodinicola acaciae TaxID=2681555 RepID=UPI0013D86C6A|nr:TetR/AcrR family transcriptional regulator [Fodinicola acaciae]
MSEKLAAGGRKAKAAETEAALKTAARRVFAERGYLNTKITDITAEAGRAAGSFYNHFAGKEELLQAMCTDMLAAGDEAVLAIGSTHSSDFTDFAAVRWHVAAFWSFYRHNRVVLVAMRQAALVSDEFSARLRELIAADQQHLISHLGFVTKAGRALPGDPDLTLVLMQSLLDAFMQRWYASDGQLTAEPVSDDEVIDTVSRFLYRAFNGCDPS